jgi:superfamily II DNA or RNA helicase
MIGIFIFNNMAYELRDYQKDLVEKALFKLNLFNKVCLQLSTGGGKTVIFSNIAENYKGRVLILVDSVELVVQTAKTIKGAGTFEAKDKVFPINNIVIAMSETIWSRSKKNKDIIKSFDLLIVDEAHIWSHNKNFDLLKPECKILGVTATPVRLKRINFFDEHNQEWTREELMSDVYDDIVCGIGIDELIEKGYLVDEQLAKIKIDESKLKTDATGEFTNDSINETFDNEKYSVDILAEYEKHCKGKKTMIFTPNTKVNLNIFNLFVDAGYNCQMYDSVNSEKKERHNIVNWFKETDSAVLFNVSCFTKGFDVTDVEAIILARATASLSLFIQIAGRGARTTDKIYKDRFIFVDAGGNSDRFGMWSQPRDWERIFFKGLKPPKKKREALDEIKECNNCGYLMARHEIKCPECGHIEEPKEKKPKEQSQQTTEFVKIIYPKADKIIKYSIDKMEDTFFALKILNNQILDLFIITKVTKEQFELSLRNGVFRKKMEKIFKPHFYKIIYSELRSESNRTYLRQLEILTNKIKKYYGI